MLVVEDLTVDYDIGAVRHRAVDRVSLRVERGEFLTLLGPSGCGKTSTLRAIAGLEQPVSGRIELAGRIVVDVARAIHVPAHRRDASMVFQSYAIWPHLTVAGNVAFPLELEGVTSEERRRRVAEVLELVGLVDSADRSATLLSGGQQQRVAIARSIVRRSPLILLDEPLSNLDAKLREQMRSELRELLKGVGATAIYVTHDQEEALALSDRIAVMSGGRIVETGAPRDLYLNPRTHFAATFLGQAELLALAGPLDADGARTEIGTLRMSSQQPPEGARATHVMIRPEGMRLYAGRREGVNTFSGRIVRSVFGGRQVACLVELAGGRRLQVLAPPFETFADGLDVTVELPPERLVAVSDEAGASGGVSAGPPALDRGAQG